MGRGRERTINCAKCGRTTRKDKMVCIDKPILSNPLERAEIHDDQYFTRLTKELCYCPSCGKHLRIYDKKIKMAQAKKEREQRYGYQQFSPRY